MAYSSKIIEQAVENLSKFPGIGSKSALRMALYLAKRPESEVQKIAESILEIKTKLKQCKECGNLSDFELCLICENPARDNKIICVVEDFKDVVAIENTAQFKGVYHILGGLISPIEGVGPEDINIVSLFQRIKNNEVKEVIVALAANMEGDTTTYYLSKKIVGEGIKISTISRGISIGSELEFTDEVTLGRSIINRIPYSL